MKPGVLRKNTFIRTPILEFRLRKGTRVAFDEEHPIISFPKYDCIKLIKAGNNWFAVLWGSPFLMLFDHSRPPYPLSFYKP